jgi:hypothetical protein
VIEQDASMGYFEFRDEALVAWQYEMHQRGLTPDQYWRCWWHSHPGESVTPSGTDETTFSSNFGQCPWSVMAIISKSCDKYSAVMRTRLPSTDGVMGLHIDVDCEVAFMPKYSLDKNSPDYVGLFQPEEWIKDLEKVHKIIHKPTVKTYAVGAGGRIGFQGTTHAGTAGRGPKRSWWSPASQLQFFGTYQIEGLVRHYVDEMDDEERMPSKLAVQIAKYWYAIDGAACEDIVYDSWPGVDAPDLEDDTPDDMYDQVFFECLAVEMLEMLKRSDVLGALEADARAANAHESNVKNWVSCYDDKARRWDANALKGLWGLCNEDHQNLSKIIAEDWDAAALAVMGTEYLMAWHDVIWTDADGDAGDDTIDLVPEGEDEDWAQAVADWEAAQSGTTEEVSSDDK